MNGIRFRKTLGAELIDFGHIFTEESMKNSFLIRFLFTSATSLLIFSQNTFAAEEGIHFKKVVWLIFENESKQPVIGQPDFAKVARAGVSFNLMYAEGRPSQPNYIAMVAGSKLGVNSNSNVDLDQTHVGDLIEKAGLDWRIYAEDYPGNCYTDSKSGKYVRKHNPLISFTNVSKNPARCAKIESTVRFFQDYANGTLPAFTMFIPNMKNSGHDAGFDHAGKWMSSQFGAIFSNPAAMSDTLFIITFDESGYTAGEEIYTVLLGANVIQGGQNNQKLNHYSLLKMVEDELGLGNLGREDAKAAVISGIWK